MLGDALNNAAVNNALGESVAGVIVDGAAVPSDLLSADRVLRRAAKAAGEITVPASLADRTIAKCATLHLDGSVAGDVVV